MCCARRCMGDCLVAGCRSPAASGVPISDWPTCIRGDTEHRPVLTSLPPYLTSLPLLSPRSSGLRSGGNMVPAPGRCSASVLRAAPSGLPQARRFAHVPPPRRVGVVRAALDAAPSSQRTGAASIQRLAWGCADRHKANFWRAADRHKANSTLKSTRHVDSESCARADHNSVQRLLRRPAMPGVTTPCVAGRASACPVTPPTPLLPLQLPR